MEPGAARVSDVLLTDIRQGVATLTLNRPEKRNALNGTLVAALKESLRDADADPTVRVVVLRGAGKDFCSGADLAELEKIAEMSLEENLVDARSLGALFEAMRACSKPIIGAVHGRALAGGCGLATACDLVVAEEAAIFGYPEVHLGFVPALVMNALRRKVGEGHAFELVVLGERFDASRAAALGLVQRLVPREAFEATVDAVANAVASRPASAVATTKRLLYELDDLSYSAGIARAAEVNAEARLTEECRAGVRGFLERSKR